MTDAGVILKFKTASMHLNMILLTLSIINIEMYSFICVVLYVHIYEFIYLCCIICSYICIY